jgi:hypothetical protein
VLDALQILAELETLIEEQANRCDGISTQLHWLIDPPHTKRAA